MVARSPVGTMSRCDIDLAVRAGLLSKRRMMTQTWRDCVLFRTPLNAVDILFILMSHILRASSSSAPLQFPRGLVVRELSVTVCSHRASELVSSGGASPTAKSNFRCVRLGIVADDMPPPAHDDHSSHLLRMDMCVTEAKKALQKCGRKVEIGCASCKTTESLRGEILGSVESIVAPRRFALGSRRCTRVSYEVDGEDRFEFVKVGLVARLEWEFQGFQLLGPDQFHGS